MTSTPCLRGSRGALAALLFTATTGCSWGPLSPTALHYDVELVATPKLTLEVSARFANLRADTQRLEVADRTASRFISELRSNGAVDFAAHEEGWNIDRPVRDLQFRYLVDLERMADELRDLHVANRAGDAIYASWTSWLLRPSGAPAGTSVELQCSASDGLTCALGGAPEGQVTTYARALNHRVYAMFGPLEIGQVEIPGHPVSIGTSRLTVAMPRAGFALGMPEILGWVEETGAQVAEFAGGFPTEKALVMISPIPGHDQVVFGRVQPSPFPTVCVFAGPTMNQQALEDDWILLHEFLHLAFPPVRRDARWIDEGIATYFEPILRARAGERTEEEAWAELVAGCRRGVAALEERGLHGADSIDDVYWGGALFCLLADVETRRLTGGERGLEDGVRALIDAGQSVSGPTRTIDELIPVMARGTGVGALEELCERYVHGHAPVDLDALWKKLGVIRTGDGVRLDDDAPWADVRRAILRRGR